MSRLYSAQEEREPAYQTPATNSVFPPLGEPRRELTTSLLHAIGTSDSAVDEWLARVEGKQGVGKGPDAGL